MIFRRELSVPKICSSFFFLQLVPVTVKFRLGFWGGQPFSCPCSQNCNALPKKDLLDMGIYKKNRPFNHIFGGDRILRA